MWLRHLQASAAAGSMPTGGHSIPVTSRAPRAPRCLRRPSHSPILVRRFSASSFRSCEQTRAEASGFGPCTPAPTVRVGGHRWRRRLSSCRPVGGRASTVQGQSIIAHLRTSLQAHLRNDRNDVQPPAPAHLRATRSPGRWGIPIRLWRSPASTPSAAAERCETCDH